MSFFKKLFGSSKEKEEAKKTGKINIDPEEHGGIKAIMREDYFKKRYTEINSKDEQTIFEGSKKMVESFFLEEAAEKKHENSCHPDNLDFIVKEGFLDFCERYNMGGNACVTMLAYAFSNYMMQHHNMKLYKDNEPESDVRFITLQMNLNGALISIYPFEYSIRVLQGERTFAGMVNQIKEKEQNPPPGPEDLFKKFKG